MKPLSSAGLDPNRKRRRTIERDGKRFRFRAMTDGRGDDCLEGEVATLAVLIEHAAAVASEPEPVASSPMEALSVVPEPESAAVRRERERIDAWIRNRLIAYPLASCFGCRKPIVAGLGGRRFRTAIQTRGRVFIATCHAEWRAGQEAAARQALGLEG